MNTRPGPITPPAPLKIKPVESRLSEKESKEMNNYGEVWSVDLSKLGNIFVGNSPSTNEEINQKRKNNKLAWARKTHSKRNTNYKGGVAFPVQNDCIETNVKSGGEIVKMTGRFIEGGNKSPAGLLVGNTIYEIVNINDYNFAEGCGQMYQVGRIYRDQRYHRLGGRTKRRALRKSSTKTRRVYRRRT